MGIKMLQALGNWLRGVDATVAEKMEDPVRDGKIAIEKAEEEIESFRDAIANLMAQNRELNRQLKAARADQEKYEGFARKAASSDKPKDVKADHVRQALELKAQADATVKDRTEQIAQNEAQIFKHRKQLAEALELVAHSENTQVSLEAREEAAKINAGLLKAASHFGAEGSGLAALRNLEKDVIHKEDLLATKEELMADTPQGKAKALEEIYGDTEGVDMNAEVARYMEEAAGTAAPKTAGAKKK